MGEDAGNEGDSARVTRGDPAERRWSPPALATPREAPMPRRAATAGTGPVDDGPSARRWTAPSLAAPAGPPGPERVEDPAASGGRRRSMRRWEPPALAAPEAPPGPRRKDPLDAASSPSLQADVGDDWEAPLEEDLSEQYVVTGGPEEDEEMPLAAHIEEMLKRLAVVIAVAGLVSLVTFPFAEYLINVIWNGVLPAGELTRPRVYGILELKLTELKVASLAGVIVALPVLVYETYQFMRPGLYHHERRYYLAAIPTSLVLAIVGVAFAYFLVLPAIFLYFTTYTQGIAGIGFGLGRTFNLILLLMAYLAIVFQIPLFIMLAMMMGIVTRRWLADRRILFWGAFLGISFIFSPDPTGMAPVIVAGTMIALFEGTLLLTKWTGQGRPGRRV